MADRKRNYREPRSEDDPRFDPQVHGDGQSGTEYGVGGRPGEIRRRNRRAKRRRQIRRAAGR